MISNQTATLPCLLVNNITKNSIEQCKFIIDNNCLEHDATIDYVYLVYCDFGHELSVADEFLCSSLLAVSKNLRMSDSLAGVTLLAFGNGCPDIFSSIAAASSGRPQLIIGELLGAGIFCTSIVAGVVLLHSDFKLACRPLLRDSTFYLLAVYLIWFYCWSGEITFYGSLATILYEAFIIIYFIYLIVALGGQALHSRFQGEYPIAETQLKNESIEKLIPNENWFKCRSESLRRKLSESTSEKLAIDSFNLTKSTNNRSDNNKNTRIHYSNGITNIQIGSFQTSCCDLEIKTQNQSYSSMKQTNETKDYKMNKNSILDKGKSDCDIEKSKSKLNSDDPQSNSFAIHEHKEAGEQISWLEFYRFLDHINPINTNDWHQAGIFGKLASIIRAPLLFATIITVPVVDNDRPLNNWNRLLNTIHCLTVPQFVLLVTQLDEKLDFYNGEIKMVGLLIGFILGLAMLMSTNSEKVPKFHSLFAYSGFIMSVAWIYTLANEIISLLKTAGIMFSMTDTAIGLGVLAWGNSLGDIVANLSLAEAGYPRMALGASIGAPLLNLLLGFGLAFTISLKPGQDAAVEYSPTISLLCSTLVIILILLMLSTLIPDETSRKPLGYFLICGYIFYFVLAVCIECELIKF